MPPESGSTRGLLRRLRWTVLRPLAHRPNGDERTRLAGPGIEFAHVREYQPGDDVRRIDWQLTARSDRAYVRESHDERGLDIWLIVDVSPSIDWGTAQGLKRDVAVELSAVAGQLLGHRGNRVGLLMFAEQTLGIVPPMPGLAHLERIVGRLRDEPPRPERGQTDLSAVLATLPRLTRRPSMIVLISDFLVRDGWADRLRALERRHEVLAVRLRDPRESELADIGIVTFEDPETGAQITVDTSDARLRQRFHDAAAAQAASIDGTLRACGVELLVVGTDDSLLGAVAGFLDARRHQRRRGALSAPGSDRADEVPVA
ncbi:MAG TPA: DUF58 domain-containing protein [Chloroflexota bacterium]|jgi:uncharacterized protein (DUF58 family)|nr:DUF58 domain-containing protein [Chloroflexota bacterium]